MMTRHPSDLQADARIAAMLRRTPNWLLRRLGSHLWQGVKGETQMLAALAAVECDAVRAELLHEIEDLAWALKPKHETERA